MEKFKTLRPLERASIILLAVLALLSFIAIFTSGFQVIALFYHLFLIAGAVGIIYGLLFRETREEFCLYGFLAFAAHALYKFIFYLCTKGFHLWEYSYYSGSEYSFSFFAFLLGLLYLVAFVSMLAFAYVNYNKKLPALNRVEEAIKPYVETLWYLPFAILGFVTITASIWSVCNSFSDASWYGAMNYASIREDLFTAVFVLVALTWKYKDGVPKKEKAEKQVLTTGGKLSLQAYCGIVPFLLLSVFTFGIWTMIWVYRMTKELNCVEGFEYRNPVSKLLLFIFVPFYSIYWLYQTALRVDKLAKTEEIWSDLSMLVLVFALCFPLGASLLIQGKVNEIILKYNR